MQQHPSEISSQAPSSLNSAIYRPAALSTPQRVRMVELLDQYFENVDPIQFEADLAEKEWVFIFTDAAGTIQGFSTLLRMDHAIDGALITAVYSGDTIIHPDFWHELELPKIWGSHVFALADEIRRQRPNARIFWFLISSGYKTYRFLPVFFREFYPSHRKETPADLQRILDVLAESRFGDEYDPGSGIIRFLQASPLRAGVAEVDDRRLRNRDIAFFVEKNPEYAQGDQLACLVEIRRDNLTAAGARMLAAGEATTG